MALEKEGYIAAHRGTTRVRVDVNADGNITDDSDEVASSRYYSINQVNANNNLADNQAVLNLFLGFVGAKPTDETTNKMTVTWGVA